MSLINDALKKAQRQRAEPPGPSDPGAAAPASRVEKRGQAMRTQTLILLVAAAAVLVVLSVVATVYLLNQPSSSSRPAAVVSKALPSAAEAPGPVIVVPVAPPVVAEKSAAALAHPPPALAPSPVAARPAPATGTEGSPRPTPSAETAVATVPTQGTHASFAAGEAASPASDPESIGRPQGEKPSARVEPTTTPPALPTTPLAAPAAPAGPDARIQTFVDSIRVTGIRSSGSDSKVLMNDRVYRVNDVVDRTLSIRLVKVETDMLSFTDAHGVVYTKNF